jgi:integrase/recombinase XerD
MSFHYNTTAAAELDHSPLTKKINVATAGLRTSFAKSLHKLSADNAMTITDYIQSIQQEINLSSNYRKNIIEILCAFSEHNNKPFNVITREDILAFLDSFRRPENSDPLHKWIGTYNLYRVNLIRFFKWFYCPNVEPDKRPKPTMLENIQPLKRREKSIYKPTDLWTVEDDLLFLKYCTSKRIKCYHAMSHDTGCRPHELLKLRIRDIVFKTVGNRQYAEISVNGKTGSRHIPLIDSIPYVKDYLDHEHPQPGNHNAIFLSGIGRSLGRAIDIMTLHGIYRRHKTKLFPRLLEDPSVLPEDKPKIRELLKKPWNPYIRRHSALTEKSKILKEHTLRQYAGWSASSDMPQIYLHYFGNESCESLLEAYGIVTPDKKELNIRSRQCPNCNEPNKPDSKFCAKCRMVLTYDAYSDTLESEKQKQSEVDSMREELAEFKESQQEILDLLRSPKQLLKLIESESAD